MSEDYSTERLDRLEALNIEFIQERKHRLTAQILTHDAVQDTNAAVARLAERTEANDESLLNTDARLDALGGVVNSIAEIQIQTSEIHRQTAEKAIQVEENLNAVIAVVDGMIRKPDTTD